MGHQLKQHSPERLILTRLFVAQRRLRFVRGLKAALHWFALGTVAAALALIALWNWDHLPGPWQWLAAAGRPGEVLWLPFLTALGGFASRWLTLPSPRQAAYRLDQMLDSQERLLTSVDWILSEKPRTRASERLLEQSAALLEDEVHFHSLLKNLEPVPKKSYGLPASLLLPVLLLFFLPAHLGLHPVTAVWLGEEQVDQLTEDLLKELENSGSPDDPKESLEKLLKQLEQREPGSESDKNDIASQREMQKTIDQLKQQAEAVSKARELLETLAQRARQSQTLSERDKKAIEALGQSLREQSQKDRLAQAELAWSQEDFKNAAEVFESLQQEAGQSAKELSRLARETLEPEGAGQGSGQEFDEREGDQFDQSGFAKGESKGQTPQEGSSEGGPGQAPGEGVGEGQDGEMNDGPPGPGPGKGTTLEDEGDSQGAQGAQSLRRSESESQWLEEYQHLHAPERRDYQRAQTRVRGETGDEGPRFRSSKEGRGQVTEGSARQGSGGFLEYREEAENAILREEVPADYRDNVRAYFESLDQGQ